MPRLSGARPDRLALIALGIVMAGSAAMLLYLHRDLLFISDEVKMLQISGVGDLGDKLEPLYGHLSVFPYLVFEATLELFGVDRLPYSLLLIAALLSCSGLIYAYARRRVGPVVALAPAAVPLFLGSAPDVLMQPLIGTPIVASVAFGLGALLALEAGSRRGDAAACLLLCLALASFSSGAAFLAAAIVGVALRDDRRRSAWIVAVPLVLYGAWRIWAMQFSGPEPHIERLLLFPLYAVDSLAAVAFAIFGRPEVVGSGPATSLYLNGIDLANLTAALVFAAIEALAIVALIAWMRRRGPVPVTFWIALAVPVALWATHATTLDEVRTPGQSRYAFTATVAVMLPLIEAARGVRFSRLATAGLLVLALAALVGNLPRFRDSRDGQVFWTAHNRAYLAVIELAGENADPRFTVWQDARETGPFLSATVGPYLRLVDRFGSPALPAEELPAQSADVREGADRIMAEALGLEAVPGGPAAAGCSRRAIPGDGLALPPGGAILQSEEGGELTLRRFGDRFTVPAGELPAGRPAELRIPPDRLDEPWQAQLESGDGVQVCPIQSEA